MITKNLSSILGRLIDLTLISGEHSINDFTPGSTILSIYEAIAMELEQYYVLGKTNIIWGIENGVYEAFDFRRREARRAYGMVVLEFHTAMIRDIYIPQGTRFYSTIKGYNQSYETLEDYYVTAGESIAEVMVYATESGSQGNVPKGTINGLGSNIQNVKRIYNPEDIQTGTDAESVSRVKRRFQEFVATRGRATKRAIEYGARSVEDVAGVYIYEETGRVIVFVHDLNGNLSEDLKTKVETSIENYRPSGISLEVRPIEKQLINIEATVTLRSRTLNSDAFHAKVVKTIRKYLNSFEASDDLIISDLTQQIMNIDDLEIYDVSYTYPLANIQAQPHEIIRAGDVTVEFKVRGDIDE